MSVSAIIIHLIIFVYLSLFRSGVSFTAAASFYQLVCVMTSAAVATLAEVMELLSV